jgi:hypothetical protein
MMRKKYSLRTLLLLLAVTATFLAFSALKGKPVTPSACKEGLEDCSKQQPGATMDWDNLSHQFFSTI